MGVIGGLYGGYRGVIGVWAPIMENQRKSKWKMKWKPGLQRKWLQQDVDIRAWRL